MTRIRPYVPGDLDALYDICLKTSDSGADGSHLYADPRIVGEIYAAPYGVLEPALAFVAEDEEGVAGYILGTADTRAFEARCEAEWWPGRRALYANPKDIPPKEWTADQQRAHQIHKPYPIPQPVVEAAAAHLHINLLPRLQGQGMGEAMLATWFWAARSAGARKVHLGCNGDNHRALKFYDAYGFARLPPHGTRHTVWMTLDIP